MPKQAGRNRKFRGSSEEFNALAALVTTWMSESDISGDRLRDLLVPEHFDSREVPSRAKLFEQLAGNGTTWELVEAVADVCSANQGAKEGMLTDGRKLWQAAQEAPQREAPADAKPAPGRADLADKLTTTTAMLLASQRREIDHLVRLDQLREAKEQSDRALNTNIQAVTMLMVMLAHLEHRLVVLQQERDGLEDTGASQTAAHRGAQKRFQVAQERQSELQEELASARKERDEAQLLSREAALQVRILQEELTHHGHLEPSNQMASIESDADQHFAMDMRDIGGGLSKIRDVRARGREDLEEARSTLSRSAQGTTEEPPRVGMSSSDNSTTSKDIQDNPLNDTEELHEEAAAAQESQAADPVPPPPYRRATDGPRSGSAVPPEILHISIARTSWSVDRVHELRSKGLHASADQLLESIGEAQGVGEVSALAKVISVVTQLRDSGRHKDALRVLEAAGEKRPVEELRGLIALGHEGRIDDHGDGYFVLRALALKRPVEEVEQALIHFRSTHMDEAADQVMAIVLADASPERRNALARQLKSGGLLADVRQRVLNFWPRNPSRDTG